MNIDTTNQKFREAADHVLQSGDSLFLTGRAGTGKTTFLKYVREAATKRHAVVAPTGIAALNAGGVTVHSMFGIPPRDFHPDYTPEDIARNVKLFQWKRKLVEKLEMLIIDEVSMVRADLLDTIDHVLRRFKKQPRRPFGGIQVLFIGDPYQLPPVVRRDEKTALLARYGSPFFFASDGYNELAPRTIELDHIYRQSDPDFIRLLNAIREGENSQATLQQLQPRVQPHIAASPPEGYITLCSHRAPADRINQRELDAIDSRSETYNGKLTGNFRPQDAPTAIELELKVGAQVMFVKNDSEGRYKNGTLATVTALRHNEVEVELHDPPPSLEEPRFSIGPEAWERTKYALNEQTGKLEEASDGSFKQIPLTLAWAVTIHKSQGLTLEKVVADVAACFDSGQTYVALSRCTTLEGLVLPAMPTSRAITVAPEVRAFMAATTAGTEA